MVKSNLLSRLIRRGPQHNQSHPEQPQQPQDANSQRPTSIQQKHVNADSYWKRAQLDSPGISSSTCAVNGDWGDPEHLPALPADYRAVFSQIAEDTEEPGVYLQHQSSFFGKLPRELRDEIYFYAFGGNRVHIDFGFYQGRQRWAWWHRVCDDPGNCPGKEYVCPEVAEAEQAMFELASGAWVKQGFEYKIGALSWLRSCKIAYQETVPILYGTTTFVLTHGIDQLFRLSRVMPPVHLQWITSMYIEIDVYRVPNYAPTLEPILRDFYHGFFDILEHQFPNVRDLTVLIHRLGHRPLADTMSPEWTSEQETMWVGPWEKLAESRSWRKLEIGLSGEERFNEFHEIIEGRGKLRRCKGFVFTRCIDPFRNGW
ncbi:uncharacterized protein BJX67DRAFT_380639 [Aspergillus lucknowensis]|uniref:DUF7730 domain-containing protein n=1 Tax=Aspergillus lucknowensis TaxID=176173 RepID=A0ABR4LT25_9EURO